MKNSENPTAKESPVSDSIKLAIRDEVERRFDAPTASFVKLIEDEVRQRIRRQEWYYWLILVISALGVYWYARTFWNTELSEIPRTVRQQLQTEGALAAHNEITNILLDAQQKNLKLNGILSSVEATADSVSKSLNELYDVAKVNSGQLAIDTQLAMWQSRLWILPVYLPDEQDFLDTVVYYHLIKGDENFANVPIFSSRNRESLFHQWYVSAPWVLRKSDGKIFTNNSPVIHLEPGTVVLQGTARSVRPLYASAAIFNTPNSENVCIPVILWPTNNQTTIDSSHLNFSADYVSAFSKSLDRISGISEDGVAFLPNVGRIRRDKP